MNFNYYMPVRIFCGRDCLVKNADYISSFGKRAIVVTGKSSAKNGALADVASAFEKAGIKYCVFDRVMPNPTAENVREGGSAARRFGADFVVAAGGGSPMDAAKVIARLAKGDAEDVFSLGGAAAEDVLPMIHIPTTAGTGSEVTPYAILTDRVQETKRNVSSPAFFPRAAFLDGKYLRGIPHDTAVYTAIDAVSHAMEGMLSVRAGALSDTLAKESLHMISSEFSSLTADALTDEGRDRLLYAAALAGMVIANTGTCAVHSMGYSLTYEHGAPHGRANGLLLPDFLAVCEERSPERVGQILGAFGCKNAFGLKELFRPLLGGREQIGDDLLRKYAKRAAANKNISNCIVRFDEEDLFRVLKSAVGK